MKSTLLVLSLLASTPAFANPFVIQCERPGTGDAVHTFTQLNETQAIKQTVFAGRALPQSLSTYTLDTTSEPGVGTYTFSLQLSNTFIIASFQGTAREGSGVWSKGAGSRLPVVCTRR